MHYIYIGFMVAAGMTLFYALLNNADLIWDLSKVLLLIVGPILVLIIGAILLYWGMREVGTVVNRTIAQHELDSTIHPSPPLESKRTGLSSPNAPLTPSPATTPTPEEVCAHVQGLPLAKLELYPDCVEFFTRGLKSDKATRAVAEAALRFDLAATNKAQTLCIFDVLTSEKWEEATGRAKIQAFKACIENNRRYDNVR